MQLCYMIWLINIKTKRFQYLCIKFCHVLDIILYAKPCTDHHVDPDTNFYNQYSGQTSNNCKYLHVDDLNNLMENKSDINLALFHLNIRSLVKLFRQLQTLIETIETPHDLI
jgi:hypothetical protein